MADKPSVLRDTDDEALKLARTLVRGARYGTLAVIDPETGFPSASRVLLATAPDGTPAILVSSLSNHTRALETDVRCSLLTGEPGKGDPLAHPRISVQAEAQTVTRDSRLHGWLRQRFLNRHPKAELYIDFGDFRFILLRPVRASLNGGFGRAYAVEGHDLVMSGEDIERLADKETAMLSALRNEAPDLASEIARNQFHQTTAGWKICALDAGGLDLSLKDILLRLEVPLKDVRVAQIASDIRKVACSIP